MIPKHIYDEIVKTVNEGKVVLINPSLEDVKSIPKIFVGLVIDDVPEDKIVEMNELINSLKT